ncbi:hypothetical protein BS78_03G119300 [Paspalum vaginatum]|nr:hypothetical protein BS78_03G119300 [Paspalum vaginatum]
MASMQKSREERARSAAQKAADELAASRRDQVHAAAPASPRGGGGGILSSVQESSRSAMGAVRGTFSSSGARDDDSASATAAAGEYAGEAEKKAVGGMADAAMGKAAEAKDAATASMESAKEYAVDKKEGVRRALPGDDAVGRKGETDESAWQQGQDVRRRAAEKAQEEALRRRAHDPPPSEEEKGRAATENIYGKARGAMGAFGEKMVMPTDVVERKRAEAAAAPTVSPRRT